MTDVMNDNKTLAAVYHFCQKKWGDSHLGWVNWLQVDRLNSGEPGAGRNCSKLVHTIMTDIRGGGWLILQSSGLLVHAYTKWQDDIIEKDSTLPCNHRMSSVGF